MLEKSTYTYTYTNTRAYSTSLLHGSWFSCEKGFQVFDGVGQRDPLPDLLLKKGVDLRHLLDRFVDVGVVPLHVGPDVDGSSAFR